MVVNDYSCPFVQLLQSPYKWKMFYSMSFLYTLELFYIFETKESRANLKPFKSSQLLS